MQETIPYPKSRRPLTRGGMVITTKFCECQKPNGRNTQRLASRLPECRKPTQTLPKFAELDRKDVAELFDYFLANPRNSVINGGRERYLIVIGALEGALSIATAGFNSSAAFSIGRKGLVPIALFLSRGQGLLRLKAALVTLDDVSERAHGQASIVPISDCQTSGQALQQSSLI